MLESLVKAGAFDFVGRDRAELFACIDESLSCAAAAQRDRTVGQVSLFDEATHAATTKKRVVTPWGDHERLSYEKELLGFYVSGHPARRLCRSPRDEKLSTNWFVRQSGRPLAVQNRRCDCSS